MNRDLKEFSIEIESTNNYEVDLNFGLYVEDVGFKLVGDYTEFQNTKLLLSGKF
jgi:hypothetical protein